MDDAATVECIANAIQPAAPVVVDACGNNIVPVITQTPDPACEGTKTYTFTYTDCAGNVSVYNYVYTIDLTSSANIPLSSSEDVDCIDEIYVPTAPVVTDACGNNIVPVMTENADPVCIGDKIFTFTYTDCAGNVSVWTYTFNVNDNIDPTASNPLPISVPGSMDVPAPDPLVVTDEADNCTTNPTVVWEGDVSDGNVCNGEIITRTYSVTDDCGNQILVTQEITILATYPPISAGPDTLMCIGEWMTLNADNPWGVNMWWDQGVVDGVAWQPQTTLNYTVTADNLGCISTDEMTLTIENLPVVSFVANELGGCAPMTISFDNNSVSESGFDNCQWFVEGNPISGDCNGASYEFEFGGSYDVTLITTSTNGCTNTTTYDDYIFMEDVPVASFTADETEITNLDTQVEFSNSSSGASTFAWDFGDGTYSNVDSPTHTFPDDSEGSYLVELMAFSPVYECPDSAYLTINVEELLIFYIPNTFTPDRDNYNETFRPIFHSGYDPYDFELLIFNRWGEIVFESHDANFGWDGSYAGVSSVAPDGVYTWKIEFKTSANDERRTINGHVNLIR